MRFVECVAVECAAHFAAAVCAAQFAVEQCRVDSAVASAAECWVG